MGELLPFLGEHTLGPVTALAGRLHTGEEQGFIRACTNGTPPIFALSVGYLVPDDIMNQGPGQMKEYTNVFLWKESQGYKMDLSSLGTLDTCVEILHNMR